MGEHIALDESIRSANEIFEKAIANNDIDWALKTVEPLVSKSLYHSYLKAMGLIVIAASTMEPDDIKAATESVTEMAKLSNKYRKHGFLTSVKKLTKIANYDKYTDLELHAELIHTYYIAMSGILCGLETYNIYGLIKVAYRLQKFIKKFKGCRSILKKRKNWDNDTSRLNFEAGVRLSNGVKNLAISQIPPNILRVVNFLGYKGEESVGFEELNKAAFELPGIHGRLGRISLLGYWILLQPHLGLGPKEIEKSTQVLNKELEEHPKSILYIGARAKLEQISGRIDSAIQMFESLLNSECQRAHKAYHLELMFSYALKCDWDQCIKYAELLRNNTLHSPALATYAEAVFRYLKSIDDNDVAMKTKASELFKLVPTLKIRNLGRTVTPEKAVVELSQKYFKNNEYMILPELQALYQGNWLVLIKDDKDKLNTFMARVDKELNHFKDDANGLDNYLSAVFYRGVILKILGNYSEAKDCFNTVIKDEKRIKTEKSIAPQAVLELGLTELEQKNTDEATKLLNKAINDYSGYLNENVVHLRGYAGLRELGISTDKQKGDDTKLEQYRKEWLKEIDVEEKNYESLIQKDEETIVEKSD